MTTTSTGCWPASRSFALEQGGVGDRQLDNAGVFTAHSPTGTSYADWQAAWARTLTVNLVGAANATFCAASPSYLRS